MVDRGLHLEMISLVFNCFVFNYFNRNREPQVYRLNITDSTPVLAPYKPGLALQAGC